MKGRGETETRMARESDDGSPPPPLPMASSEWSPTTTAETDGAPCKRLKPMPPPSPCLSHGSVSYDGRRRVNEDAVTVAPPLTTVPGYHFFGVYDGHGGASVAEACRDRMHVLLAEEAAAAGRGGPPRDGEEAMAGWWREAMTACFAKMDGEVEDDGRDVGSTALVALVGMDRIVVANCGDSRAVLSRGGGEAVPLSSDHKPNREDEMERVEAAGGRVEDNRVLGLLATSRSIGDHYLKPYVISEPEVMVIDRIEKDEFLILASDGLWDVMSNEESCKATRDCFTGQAAKNFPEVRVNGQTATDAAALLADLAINQGSRDNISVVVVQLKKY